MNQHGGRRQGKEPAGSLMLYHAIKKAKDGNKILIAGIDRDIVLTVNIVEKKGVQGMEFRSVVIDEVVK